MSKPEKEGLSYEEINQPYYFESDHVALKENEDYRNLLQCIALLEAQRQQAAEDIDLLYAAQEKALADPLTFVENLQKGVDLELPKQQKIVELPKIEWDDYTRNSSFLAFGSVRQTTRNKNSHLVEPAEVQALKSRLANGQRESKPDAAVDEDVIVVRGRAKDSSKPATFNKLWTEEEQSRLERLLIQFPPEEVEAKRWAKIADALGNRTPVQVASRVQKYFLRLAREGLPVPGRMPSASSQTKRSSHRHQRYNRMYYPSSTLLQSHVPPVWMQDGDDLQPLTPAFTATSTESLNNDPEVKQDISDEEFPEDMKTTEEYVELVKLKRLRDEMLKKQNFSVQHFGYKCDNCGCEPITGTRWHCIDCPTEMSFDFCDACSDVPLQQEAHNSSHRLKAYREPVNETGDYTSFTKSNYLDPNFIPPP